MGAGAPGGRDMENITYELKYCERCGTLKLRQVESVSTYCRSCEGLLARFRFARDDGAKSDTVAPPGLRMLAKIPVVVVSQRLAGRGQ